MARRVVAADDLIDVQQREIEEKAISTIARRQPMAIDLREIVGALRISNDLERVGDLAENTAKRVVLLGEECHIHEVMLQFRRMVESVREQLRRVLQSYERHDVVEALEVWRKDEEVDALNTALFRELVIYMMENPHNIAFGTHLFFCSKNIEPAGDHVINIAETVYYLVEGRSLSEERPKADVTSKGVLPLFA